MNAPTSTTAPGSDDPDAKRRLVANERIKLMATALNNGAVAAVIASIVGPAASGLYGITTPRSPYWWEFGLAWIMLAVILHLVARRVIGDLKP